MMAIARIPPCRAIVVRPVISGIAAGSRMKGNACGALLLRGSRVGRRVAKDRVQFRSPDERSDIRDHSHTAPDIVALIRATSQGAVVARSEATKQSVSRREESWIASLRSQ
jgi:hypothetical protein